MSDFNEPVIGEIQSLLAGAPRDGGVSEGARFWETLASKHVELLRIHGFRNFKRTLNFEYSQWGVSTFRDTKIRRLLRVLLSKPRLAIDALSARFDFRDGQPLRWPDGIDLRTGEARVETVRAGGKGWRGRLRVRAYAFYLGLLWQFARGEDRLGILDKVEEPGVGNPLPVRFRGRLISQDLAWGALELNRIHSCIALDGVRRVLEIGAGYGRLAWLLKSLYPQIEYSIVDIPPALAVSRKYLEETLGRDSVAVDFWGRAEGLMDASVRLVTPDALEGLPDGHFDLILNISSFDEMDPSVVHEYFRAINRLGAGAVYLKGYARTRSEGRLGLESFPRSSQWNVAYTGEDPVVPGFIEMVWRRESSRTSSPA